MITELAAQKGNSDKMSGECMAGAAGSKSAQVREVFERASRYLERRRYDITIRRETVGAMASDLQFERILDIGCGDGSISLPLLRAGRHLTLLDFSSQMTAIARSKVPPELAANIEVRNDDFAAAAFAEKSFDLIVCMGVMAHADSPDQLIGKIRRLLKPGGTVILEFTDAYHPTSWLGRTTRTLRGLVSRPLYDVNLFSFRSVQPLISRHGFQITSMSRYGMPAFLGLERFLSQETRYRIVRAVFGSYPRNRNRWLGNEYICVLKTEGTEVAKD